MTFVLHTLLEAKHERAQYPFDYQIVSDLYSRIRIRFPMQKIQDNPLKSHLSWSLIDSLCFLRIVHPTLALTL